MDHVRFWQRDLLAGLLMQAVIIISRNLSGPSMLQCLLNVASSVTPDASGLNSRLLTVPETAPASSMTWLAIFWNMLDLMTTVQGRSTGPSGFSTLTLTEHLTSAFAYNLAESSKKEKKKILAFWHDDCLAQVLLQGMQSYINSGHAKLDVLTIQDFLMHPFANQEPQPAHWPASHVLKSAHESSQAANVKPVDAATLAAAVAELQDGSGPSSLARLEQRLLRHFQVL